MNGTIARFAIDKETGRRKGFAFIKGEDGREYFFHATDAGSRQFADLCEGDAVTFEPTPGTGRGPRAAGVAAARRVG